MLQLNYRETPSSSGLHWHKHTWHAHTYTHPQSLIMIGEMVDQLKSLAILPEYPDSIPNIASSILTPGPEDLIPSTL